MENQISVMDNINRRKFTRFDFQNDFVLETEKFQIIPDTYSRNLSQKGAQLITSKEIAVGTITCIEIPSAKLQLIAEVRWVEPEENGRFSIGVAFHELFPQTKQKISEFIEQLQEKTSQEDEGIFLSLDLELSISSFLNQYNEGMRSDSMESFPKSSIRPTSTDEKRFSIYTPSKSKSLDFSSTSFRLEDDKTIEARNELITFRKVLLLTLALIGIGSVIGYQIGLFETIAQLMSPFHEKQTEGDNQTSAITSNEMDFNEGTLEKISWKESNQSLEITFYFRETIAPEQIQISRINIDQPRELIVISNVENKLDQKNINLGNPLAGQIRLGLHENQLQSDLHIVIDVTSPDVTTVIKNQDEKSMTIQLQSVNG